ncbi:MAG: hypothetical protein AB7G11_01715 [Phycisphaerales bacterium]
MSFSLGSSRATAQISLVPSTAPFTDISAIGTPIVPFSDDSETILTVDLLGPAGWGGNRVFAGGVSVLVGNNGGIIWNPIIAAADQIGFANTPLPGSPSNSASGGNGNGLRQFLAVLWDDHLPSDVSPPTELDWRVIDGDLLIQWTNEDNFDAVGPGRVTFQVRFFSQAHVAQNGVVASLIYDDTFYGAGLDAFNDGASATIGYIGNGVSEASGTLAYSFNKAAVAGYRESASPRLPHALDMRIPSPTGAAMAILGVGAAGVVRRSRR